MSNPWEAYLDAPVAEAPPKPPAQNPWEAYLGSPPASTKPWETYLNAPIAERDPEFLAGHPLLRRLATMEGRDPRSTGEVLANIAYNVPTTLLERGMFGLGGLAQPLGGLVQGMQQGIDVTVDRPLATLLTMGGAAMRPMLWGEKRKNKAGEEVAEEPRPGLIPGIGRGVRDLAKMFKSALTAEDVQEQIKPFEEIALQAGWTVTPESRNKLAGIGARIAEIAYSAKRLIGATPDEYSDMEAELVKKGFDPEQARKQADAQRTQETFDALLKAMKEQRPAGAAHPIAALGLMAGLDIGNVPSAAGGLLVMANIVKAAGRVKMAANLAKLADATAKLPHGIGTTSPLGAAAHGIAAAAKPLVHGAKKMPVLGRVVKALNQGTEAELHAAAERVAGGIAHEGQTAAKAAEAAVEAELEAALGRKPTREEVAQQQERIRQKLEEQPPAGQDPVPGGGKPSAPGGAGPGGASPEEAAHYEDMRKWFEETQRYKTEQAKWEASARKKADRQKTYEEDLNRWKQETESYENARAKWAEAKARYDQELQAEGGDFNKAIWRKVESMRPRFEQEIRESYQRLRRREPRPEELSREVEARVKDVRDRIFRSRGINPETMEPLPGFERRQEPAAKTAPSAAASGSPRPQPEGPAAPAAPNAIIKARRQRLAERMREKMQESAAAEAPPEAAAAPPAPAPAAAAPAPAPARRALAPEEISTAPLAEQVDDAFASGAADQAKQQYQSDRLSRAGQGRNPADKGKPMPTPDEAADEWARYYKASPEERDAFARAYAKAGNLPEPNARAAAPAAAAAAAPAPAAAPPPAPAPAPAAPPARLRSKKPVKPEPVEPAPVEAPAAAPVEAAPLPVEKGKGLAGRRKKKAAPAKAAPAAAAPEAAPATTTSPLPDPIQVEPAIKRAAATGQDVEVAPGMVVRNVDPRIIGVDAKRFQFRSDVSAEGVESPLQGKWDPNLGYNMLAWEDNQGKLWIVDGHHRLALAKARKVKSLPLLVIREAEGYTNQMARAMGAERNIAVGSGKEADFARFFRNTNLDEATARERGLLRSGPAGAKGHAAFVVARSATDDLFGAAINERVTWSQAEAIARAAPNHEAAQGIGIEYVVENPRVAPEELSFYVQSILADAPKKAGGAVQLDLFQSGAQTADVLAWKALAKKIAKAASEIQRDLRKHRQSIAGTVKHHETAATHGVMVEDLERARSELTAIDERLRRWQHGATDRELQNEARARAGLPARGEDVAAPAPPPSPAEAPRVETPGQGFMFGAPAAKAVEAVPARTPAPAATALPVEAAPAVPAKGKGIAGRRKAAQRAEPAPEPAPAAEAPAPAAAPSVATLDTPIEYRGHTIKRSELDPADIAIVRNPGVLVGDVRDGMAAVPDGIEAAKAKIDRLIESPEPMPERKPGEFSSLLADEPEPSRPKSAFFRKPKKGQPAQGKAIPDQAADVFGGREAPPAAPAPAGAPKAMPRKPPPPGAPRRNPEEVAEAMRRAAEEKLGAEPAPPAPPPPPKWRPPATPGAPPPPPRAAPTPPVTPPSGSPPRGPGLPPAPPPPRQPPPPPAAAPAPAAPPPPLTGQALEAWLRKQRQLGRGEQAVEALRSVHEELERVAGVKINPLKADDVDAIIEAIADAFLPVYRKSWEEVFNAYQAAGVSIDHRGNYVLHTYRPEMRKWLRENMTTAALRENPNEPWIERFGMTKTEFDQAAESSGLWPKDRPGGFSALLLEWADNEVGAVPGIFRGGKPISAKAAGKVRAIPGNIDAKNAKLKQLLGIDFDALETDNTFLMAEGWRRAGKVVGARRQMNVMLHEHSYAAPRPRRSDDRLAVNVMRDAGLTEELVPDLFENMKGRYIPKEIDAAMARELLVAHNPEEMAKIVSWYRGVMGQLSKLTLAIGYPGYIARNNFTGVWKNGVHGGFGQHFLPAYDFAGNLMHSPSLAMWARLFGMEAGEAVTSLKGVKQLGSALAETGRTGGRAIGRTLEVAPGLRKFGSRLKGIAAPKILEIKEFDLAKAGKLTRQQLMDEIDQFDAVVPVRGTKVGGSIAEAGGALEQFRTAKGPRGEAILKEAHPTSALVNEAMAEAGRNDNLHRLANYIGLRMNGVEPLEAVRRVNQLHFAMDVLSKVERGSAGTFGLRDLGFFYSWRRKSIPWGVAVFVNRLERYHAIGKAYQIMGEYQPDSEDPYWMRRQPRVALPATAGMRSRWIMGEIPEMDMVNMVEDVLQGNISRIIGGGLAPPIGMLLERLTGRDEFMNQLIESVDTVPDSWLVRILPGMNPSPSGMTGRVAVDPYWYHFYRRLAVPLGRALSEASAISREGIAGFAAQELLPGKSYTYRKQVLDFMRHKDVETAIRTDVYKRAQKENWISSEGSGHPRDWVWTPRGRQEGADAYRFVQSWVRSTGRGRR